MNHAYVNGVKIYSFSKRSDLIKFVEQEKKSLIAVNAEKIMHATDDTRSLINQNIGYTDGAGAIYAMHKKGFKKTIKIPGCELWLDIVKSFYKDKSFYIAGAKEEVIQETISRLKNDFPGINILGYRNGYLQDDNEEETLIHTVAELKPDIVFVAMGSPKQELLIQKMLELHPAIYQGLGGSFDIYTGRLDRAPDWWIRNNLEWAYRLLKQPSRINRQIHLVRFVFNLIIGRY